MQGNVLVAQGGGPTAVINQSLVGVVSEARRFAGVKEIYGAVHGVRGIVDENLVNLTRETAQNLEMVGLTPSAALGSTRDKPDHAYCKEIFRVLQAHEVGCFFYIGGNDSADTVRIVSEEAQKSRYDLRCVHIPKTIDNDLMGSDHVPGYPSAARFVAQAFMGLNLDNRRRLCGGGDGSPCGVPDGGLGTREVFSRRWPASHLSARTYLLGR